MACNDCLLGVFSGHQDPVREDDHQVEGGQGGNPTDQAGLSSHNKNIPSTLSYTCSIKYFPISLN